MKWQQKYSIIKELSRREFKIEKVYNGIVNGQTVTITRYEPSNPPSTQGIPCIPMTTQGFSVLVSRDGKVKQGGNG